MARRANPARGQRAEATAGGRDGGHPLSPAFLAMCPLLLAYECAIVDLDGRRNAAELFLGLWLTPFGSFANVLRWAILVTAAGAALLRCRQAKLRVREAIARIWLEAIAIALTLGPILVGLGALVSDWVPRLDVSWDATRDPPGLALAGYLFGGAVYEELLFRVGLHGLLFWTFVRAARTCRAGESLARGVAEVGAQLGAALAFSAFHFRRFTHLLWDGGAAFSVNEFVWLTFAGVLLGIVYRWRGPGVAACAHGLFNLALLIGIDPDVLM